MVKLPLFMVFNFLFLGLLLTSFLQEPPPLKYMQVATIKSGVSEEESIVTTYKDTLANDFIYLRTTKESVPLYYYKNVKGGVCFDDECRLLDMVVYWNITGRYLGFELPKGEFLSKYDHEPFSESEYQRLHSLLADASIPLDAISFEKLLEQPKNDEGVVDAVSGATSKSVADMVVKGAAYTTYKLWNIVNGPTMDIVSKLTEKQLTPTLIYRILQSPDISDRLWALNRMDALNVLTPQLEDTLLEIISSDDFYLSYSAINAINAIHLKSVELQQGLFANYPKANHSIQTALLKKLIEAPFLSSEIIQASRVLLPQLNGQQLNDLLQLYTKHMVIDKETYIAVSKILENKNKYISKKAYVFLIGLHINDDTIIELLDAY
jgi:multisubunit Na+/H+ antiporter MnhF subunit